MESERQSRSLPENGFSFKNRDPERRGSGGSLGFSSFFPFIRKHMVKNKRKRYSERNIPSIRINSGQGPLPSNSSSSGDTVTEGFDPVRINKSIPYQPDQPRLLRKQENVDHPTFDLGSKAQPLRSQEGSNLSSSSGSETDDEDTSRGQAKFRSTQSPRSIQRLPRPAPMSPVTGEKIYTARTCRPRMHSIPATPPRRPIHIQHLHPHKTQALQAGMTQESVPPSTRFSLPGYFRRLSQQGLLSSGSDSMVSLANRLGFAGLVSFIAEDNFPGFHHFLDSRRVMVDDRDENGTTALIVAAARGKTNFVRALIEHGADVNAEDEDNWTALMFAAKEGHDELVSDLLDNGAQVDHRDMGGWTPLMWASYKGRTRSARILMEKGKPDVNTYGSYNVTCLGWAAGRGYVEIARDLIQHGAKVNTGDKYGTTPLIWAARRGNLEIVEMLLQAEAMIDASGMTSWTPLLVATAGNHVEVVKLLLDYKPNANAFDKDGCSALSIACKEGYHEIAVMLLNYGAYINVSDRGGSSNLVHAAKGGHRSIVEALLKRHADVNVCGKDRKSALYWAVEKSHVGVVKLILGSNPDLEVATKDGDTVLIKAVRNRNIEIVALLLEKRAKVSAADKNGDNCLHISMRARSKAIVELILRNPVHSQLLYRPNRCGETPYNIDRGSPKPILPQIFGHRGLNTQEDGENLLGYNLYSSALADMLSDPTLNMPITVGLFARWGSGKSFLLNKLREEMMNFARQWFNPVLSFSYLVFILTLALASFMGVIGGLCVTEYRWIFGASITAGIMILVHFFLFLVWFSTKRAKYEWSLSHRVARYLATKFDSLKLIFQVIFCHPPGAQFSDQIQAQPINFYFTEQGKISSTTGGENSVVQMLGSLYMCLEKDYGTLPTRLYRAFKPRSISSTADWKWRKMCCIPYFLIFFFCFVATLTGSVIAIFSFSSMGDEHTRAQFNSVAVKVVMYSCILLVGLLIVANLYTIGQIIKTIVFSHRRHLQRAVSKMYALKAEGFLSSLKSEVNLLTEMVKCLDGFTGKQSRMVVIVDGLDSGEQEKVLQVLDAVHILFSDPKAPFIILLAIDPHIIAKMVILNRGIELNVHAVLNESNIGGHEFLRNLVHLPFFLQNAALRKVKHVKMLESAIKQKKAEEDPGPQIVLSTRRASVESAFGVAMPLERFEKPSTKKGRRPGLKMSESIASSLGSNLNKAMSTTGPTDLKKILLGDDYFSEINPKSMRRLMNIIHITGRLLKAFNIDFNWYHLSTWVNVTEQWPYRLSWMVLYAEQFQKDFDDGMSLKTVYDRVRPFIPISKEVDPNVSLDRDDKKLNVYLGLHKASLLVSTMYVFLPFTISLDPQLRRDIQELHQPLDQIWKQGAISSLGTTIPPSTFLQHPGLRYRPTNGNRGNSGQYNPGPLMPTQPFYTGQIYPGIQVQPGWPYEVPLPATLPMTIQDQSLIKDLRNRKLGAMTAEGVCDMLKTLTCPLYANLTKYEDIIKVNNICGRVLVSCDLTELKQALPMSFGDWELFKSVVVSLRELESAPPVSTVPPPLSEAGRARSGSFRLNVSTPDRERNEKKLSKPNVLEKQVTMEDELICGALELLNDDARDDALKGDASSGSTLSPINSASEEAESGRDEPRPSRSPRPSRHLEEGETDVLYVLGSSFIELPESPQLGLARASPRKFDTVYSLSNEITRSPARNRKSLSQPKEVESQAKVKAGILVRSPSKTRRSRTSFSERKGISMNPKAPGMSFDSRKGQRPNTPSHTSSDDEAKGLLPIGTRRVPLVSESQPQRIRSPKKRTREENTSNRFLKIRSIFTRDGDGEGRSFGIEGYRRRIRNGQLNSPFSPVSSSEPTRISQYVSPAPLAVFGSNEYNVIKTDIKSDNPPPSSSNESELGSTPENISSGEILFLPGPPDLPAESPYPRRFVPLRTVSTNDRLIPTVGFVIGERHPVSNEIRDTKMEQSPGPSHQLLKTELMNSVPVVSSSLSSLQDQPGIQDVPERESQTEKIKLVSRLSQNVTESFVSTFDQNESSIQHNNILPEA